MRETGGNAVVTRKGKQSEHFVRGKTDGKPGTQNTKDRLCLIPKSMFYVHSSKGTCPEYYDTVLCLKGSSCKHRCGPALLFKPLLDRSRLIQL